MGQKITYTCDMCGKDAIITVDIYPTGKVPHGGSRDDLCMECLQIILETVSLPNAIDIFTKQDPPKVIKKPLRAKQPVVEKIQIPTVVKTAPKTPIVLEDNFDLTPDEVRDKKEIIAAMDRAAALDRDRAKKSISLESLIEKKYAGGEPLDENCSHIGTQQVLDKSKGYTQCTQCGRGLIQGREIS